MIGFRPATRDVRGVWTYSSATEYGIIAPCSELQSRCVVDHRLMFAFPVVYAQLLIPLGVEALLAERTGVTALPLRKANGCRPRRLWSL